MKIEKITPQIAALYLGQKCDVKWLYTDTIDDAFKVGDIWSHSEIHGAHITRLTREEISIIPHLRRLDSITEDEARHCYEIKTGEPWTRIFNVQQPSECLNFWFFEELDHLEDITGFRFCLTDPLCYLYLLSKGFDLFDLIDSGLAKEIPRS